MKTKNLFLISGILVKNILIATAFIACNHDTEIPYEKSEPVLVQISVIDALLQGFYDGFYSLTDLKKHGEYGIGTFHALDGEMIFINDTVYKVKADGEVVVPSDDVLTPFAVVTPLTSDTVFYLSSFTFEQLENEFDNFFPTGNIFYIVRIKGKFNYVRTRSVSEQTRPYRPLAEITKNQPEFEFKDIHGDIIGFYCPAYARGINLVGLHLHFLTSDRTGGGHLLEFDLVTGEMEIGYLLNYKLVLPPDGDFYGGNFFIDRTKELADVER